MEFPLAERELTRLAKNKRMYLLRVAPAVIAAAVASVVASLASAGDFLNPAESVSGVFTWLATLFQMVVLALVVPITASGQIAREKEERTLGLLMLADLRGGDVFLSKFVSVTVNAWLLILSTLPLLAIGAILGGIAVPEAAARVLAALACAAAVASFSLLASALVQKAESALGAAFAFFLGFILFTAALEAVWRNVIGTPLCLSPFVVLFSDASTWAGPFYWMPSALLSLFVAAALGLWTARLLPRLAQDKPARGRQPRAIAVRESPQAQAPAQPAADAASGQHGPAPVRERFGARHNAFRRLFLGSNEAAYLFRAVMEPNAGKTVVFVLLSVVLSIFGSCFGVLLVTLLIAQSVVTPVRKFFDEGGFDDLLLAAADPNLLAGGLYRVLLYRALPFVLPLGVVAGAVSALPLVSVAGFRGEFVFLLVCGAVVGTLQLAFAVAVSATEAFLKSKASSAVTASTIAVVLVQIGAGVGSTLAVVAANTLLYPESPQTPIVAPAAFLATAVLVYSLALVAQWRSYRRTFARKVG